MGRQESPPLAEAQCHNMDEKADEIRMPPLERRTSTPPPLDLKVSPGVCSFLHLVTCWHQNLTHALRKNVELGTLRCASVTGVEARF